MVIPEDRLTAPFKMEHSVDGKIGITGKLSMRAVIQ
jgi:hypothetical protein